MQNPANQVSFILFVFSLACGLPQPAYADTEGIGIFIYGALTILFVIAFFLAFILRGVARLANKGEKKSAIARMDLPTLTAAICLGVPLLFAGTYQVTIKTRDALRLYQDHALAITGDPAGARRLADDYYIGIGTQQDWDEAAKWYRRASESKDREAIERLAGIYSTGAWGATKDMKEAVKWYRLAADNNVEFRYELAEIDFMGEEAERNYPEALKIYRSLAESDDNYYYRRQALQRLTEMYHGGLGVQKDDSAAWGYLELAIHMDSAGTTPDGALLKKRAELEASMTRDQIAQARMALAEATKDSIAPYSALDFYETAYDYEHAANGRLMDMAEASQNYLKAAERGHTAAMQWLGRRYRNGGDEGEGIVKDDAESYFWFSLCLARRTAARHGTIAEDDLRHEIANSRQRISVEQAAAVDARVAQWKPKVD